MDLDGAAVNLGVYGGVGKLQTDRIDQHMTLTHCTNHVLELAVLDVRKCPGYRHLMGTAIKI